MAPMYAIYFCLLLLFARVYAYMPVVLYHGVLSGSESMVFMQHYIEHVHPGTKVYNCELYSNWFSLENAWKQVFEFREYLRDIANLHSEGLIVIGFSQGGLIARTAIQSWKNHNVKIFISLSSPQAGQFGSSFLHIIFPDLVAKTAYELFYTSVGQHTSVGNYWNDPHQQILYRKNCLYLPYVNNEIVWANATEYKHSLMRLEKMVLIGGPDDGVITPWQSSHFGFFNSSLYVIPFYYRDIYKSDKIGLKALAEQGKLLVLVKSKVKHWSWHTDAKILKELIVPHLI